MNILQFDFIQFTEAEQEQLDYLSRRKSTVQEILSNCAKDIATAQGEELDELKNKTIAYYEQNKRINEAIKSIYEAAQERYTQREATEQEILEDARKVLAVGTKEYFENELATQKTGFDELVNLLGDFLGKNKDKLSEAEQKQYEELLNEEIGEPTWASYAAYLISITGLQLLALSNNDYTRNGKNSIVDLIIAQASEAYEPPEEPPELYPEQAAKPDTAFTNIVRYTPLENAELPVDKVNSNIVNLLANRAEGQLSLANVAVDTIRADKNNPEPLVTASVDFTGLEEHISKSISYFDKRVMTAINTLWENSETNTTLSRVYTATGGKGRPAAVDIEKIKNSIVKQMKIVLTLSNKLEVDQGYNYDAFEYTGNLLLVRLLTAKKDNKTVEGRIQIYGKPPLIDFAKKRDQITTIPLKMLQAPINKTERNLAIEDYLQVRVCRDRKQAEETAIKKHNEYIRAKSQKAFRDISITKKILFATVMKDAEINGRMAIHRAKETIQKILDYYKEENIEHITACKYEADAVTLTYTFTPEQIAQAIAIKNKKKR